MSTVVVEDDEDEDEEGIGPTIGTAFVFGGVGGITGGVTGGVTGFLPFLRQQHHHKSKISASNANPPTIHPIKIFLSRRAKRKIDTV